jgi:predicted CoA-binding protein
MSWRANLITGRAEIASLLRGVRRIAVLGIRSERFAGRPAFFVPAALAAGGLEIVPVPVYEADVTNILGQPVYRALAKIPGALDIVDVFRRPADIPQHIEDILLKRPPVVWFQSGIRNDAAAETLAREGIKVVQDRCLMVEFNTLRYA